MKVDNLEEAKLQLSRHQDKATGKFCPLIVRQCRMDCICLQPAHLGGPYTNAEEQKEYYYVYPPVCINTILQPADRS